MSKTFDQSLIDIANIPMSMIDPDDMKDKTSEEFIGLRRVQQGCHSELSNKEEFPFNKAVKIFKTRAKKDDYHRIEGKIRRVWIDGENVALTFDKDINYKAPATGKPRSFGFTYNPEEIRLYPTPDKEYNIKVSYIDTKNVIYQDGTYGYEIKANSKLRMPEWIQHLYFDALEYYTLATNMRKVSNPRWQPTLALFEQRWRTFLRNSQPTENKTYFTI